LSGNYAPVISGIKIETKVGDTVSFASEYKLNTVFQVISFFEKEELENEISEIHYDNKSFYVYLRKGNVVKFSTLSDFENNDEYILNFVQTEDDRVIMELIEDNNPIYRKFN